VVGGIELNHSRNLADTFKYGYIRDLPTGGKEGREDCREGLDNQPSEEMVFCFASSFSLLFSLLFTEVYFDVNKSSHSVLWLNSSSLPFSFILPLRNSFSRSHFSIYIYVYITFPPYSASYTLSLCPPLFH
jgi:hypothetical protein